MRKPLWMLLAALMVVVVAAPTAVQGAGTAYLVQPFTSDPGTWTASWYDAAIGSRNRITSISDGVSGRGINVSIPTGSHFGSAAQYRFADQGLDDPDELYYRYFIRLPTTFKNYGTGKIPGPAGLYSSSGRNGIKPSDANPGWSARMQFSPSSTPSQPNTTAIGFYVYHRDQPKSTGDSLMWDPSAGVLTHGTWHCVEGHVSMNTPGAKNGLLEGWVDEQLAFYRDDFRFLGSADAALGVQSFWFDTYYGGTDTAPGALNFQFDELALSAERVGCGNIPTARFTDTGDSVHEASIERLAYAGVTYGCNPPANDRFCPTRRVTRGAMAAFLTRALDLPPPKITNRFVDDDDSVFEASIDRLASSGVTSGCNPPANDRFCPDRTVTRGQMAAFLTRGIPFDPPTLTDRFVDDDDSEFEYAIDWLASAGVTKGCNPPTNDRFCPDAFVTREQMATFLSRALSLPDPPAPEVSVPADPVPPAGYSAIVPVGWSIQAVSNSQPNGAAIYLASGTHEVQSVTPKPGQSFGGAPGTILDGGGVVGSAFGGSVDGVTVRDVEVRNYGKGFQIAGNGWTVQRVTARSNGIGIDTTGDNLLVDAVTVVDSKSQGIRADTSRNLIIRDSVIDNSNTSRSTTYSAGISLTATVDAIVERTTVKRSYGYGVWFTDGATDTTIRDSSFIDNQRSGIVHDRAYGSSISDNAITGNGRLVDATWFGAGILIFGPDATVARNVVGGNNAAVILFAHTSNISGPSGAYLPTGTTVVDNQIVESGRIGGTAPGYPQVFTTSTFQGNAYRYGNVAGSHWAWNGGLHTWASWQSLGMDTTGSLTPG